jgi:translation elongation factor EF-1alpha
VRDIPQNLITTFSKVVVLTVKVMNLHVSDTLGYTPVIHTYIRQFHRDESRQRELTTKTVMNKKVYNESRKRIEKARAFSIHYKPFYFLDQKAFTTCDMGKITLEETLADRIEKTCCKLA